MSDSPVRAIKPEAFDQELVHIQVGYNADETTATIEVFPREAVIYYDPERPGNSRKTRQVRWVARNLVDGDRVSIRPKGSQPDAVKRLFNPEEQGEFEVTHQKNSIASGPPERPDFGTPPRSIRWEYDVIVKRNGGEIGFFDPIILIKKDD